MKRPQKDNELSARRIGRRAMILGGRTAGLYGRPGARMRYMQVEEADKFRLLAEDNRIRFDLIPPARGLIFDRKRAAYRCQ